MAQRSPIRRLLSAALMVAVIGAIVWSIRPDRGGPKVGSVAPPIEVETLAGAPFSLAAQTGKVVVLDFWATWCPPCQKSLPALQALHARYAADDRVIIASVNTDFGANRVALLKQFMAQRQFNFPVLLEDRRKVLSMTYDVRSIPTLVVIDGTGKVRHVQVGIPSNDPEEIARHVDGRIHAVLDDT
ncbi:MAG: TlpA family protein disulfide reductase [Myxococcales bacterium]|nr:TlpA family protein disulfide reductase [Myxococcales bacterium]